LGAAPVTDDDDLFVQGVDATDLTPEERVGLIPTYVVSRDDLNRAERANIAKGLLWAQRSKIDVLDADSLMTLHKRMYGDVWRWAGEQRATEKNIGIAEWWKIRELLLQLLGNVAAQVEYGGRDPDEIAIDFHHQLVAIHVFPNGNGRHGRLVADILAERLGRQPFSWGRSDLVRTGDARIAYVAAMKSADVGDLGPLLAFARS
jgi:Fic-DOC domain mobile mystery protein B